MSDQHEHCLRELRQRAAHLDDRIRQHLDVLRRPPLTLSLLAEPEALAVVRTRVVTHLTGWGLPELGEAAALCVSELLTNVLVHVGAGAPATVSLTWSGSHARLAVRDADRRALPVLLAAAPDAESGRGMALVDALALRWGVEQHADGKTVWCALR